LDQNQISTIVHGTFAGLTALREMYGAWLWTGVFFLLLLVHGVGTKVYMDLPP
jgi:hypothetical protein